MNNAEKKFVKKIKSISNIKKPVEIPAFMGDLDGRVRADDNGNSYVVTYNGDVLAVKNNVCPNIPRIPVIIGYADGSGILEVLRLRNAYDGSPYLNIPAHAKKTHGEYSVDPVRVTNGQILPGLAFPFSGTLTIQFYGCVYYLFGWHILQNAVLDFTNEIPLTGAHFVLVEVDDLGIFSFRAGASVASVGMLKYDDIPALSATKAALFAVSVYAGQTEIRKSAAYTDIYDLRFSGAASGGIASVIDWGGIINVPASISDAETLYAGIDTENILHTHGSFKWVSAGGATFDLPDFAQELIAVYDNALRVDPGEITLANDYQIVFDETTSAGHIISADYILARIP